MTFPAPRKKLQSNFNVAIASKLPNNLDLPIAFKLRSNLLRDTLYSIFLAILLLAITPLFTSTTALAQNNNASQYNTPNFNPDVPRNQHTFAQSAMIEVVSSIFCIITGIDPINPAQGCLDIDPKTHKLGLRPPQKDQPQIGGLIGLIPGMFSQVYTPPASGADYLHYLAGNFGITQPAYAATTSDGFNSLKLLLPLWTAMRNIVYLLFVLIFVIIGLAIMLRVKIDPRTVMTLQNQIPRVIIGILLITFSYAIAGLMVDGMWLLTYAGINTIAQADPSTTNPTTTDCDNNTTLQQRITQNLLATPLTFSGEVLRQGCRIIPGSAAESPLKNGLYEITWGVSYAVGAIVSDLIKQFFTGGVDVPPVCGWTDVLCWIGFSLSAALGIVIGIIAGIISLLIVFLILFISLARLWWELLKSYVMILIYVITAPVFILLGLLPGRPLGFEKWFRRMLAHLLVFPAVIILLMFASIMAKAFSDAATATPNTNFVPPLIGQPNMSSFGWLIAFAIILMTPSLLEFFKKTLKTDSEGGKILGAGVIGGVASGAAGPKALGKSVWDIASQRNPGELSRIGAYITNNGKPTNWFGRTWQKYESGSGYTPKGTKTP